jgi:outer membrane protein insertion porin family
MPAVEVNVVGATPELEQLIRQTVQTQPGQPTTPEQLQADVAILQASGFFTMAAVQTEELPQGLKVTYQVEPVVVRTLQVEGARQLDPTIAIQALQPLIGQPINPVILEQGIDQINQWYFLNGYKLSQVEGFQATPDGDVTILVLEPVVRQVSYQFVNEEGSPVDEDGEPVTGRTRASVIEPAIQIQPGMVFDEDQALEDVERLRNLGFFDAVVVDVELDGEFADVTYNLAESLARRVNFGGGFNTDIGLFVTVNYTDRNFGGVGDRLSLGAQISARGLQFGTRFTSPYRESHPNRLGYSIFAGSQRRLSPVFTDEVELPNGDRVRENRIGGGFSIMRPVEEWDAELGLSYNRVSLRDEDGDLFAEDELGNELSASGTGADDLFLLSLEMTRDRRDNPDNPGDGSVLTLGTDQSLPIGDGNIFLNRLRASYAYYVPVDLLGHGHRDNPEVLAFNVQAGTIIGDLPPYEAFALGGTSSVRGFEEGEVGTGRSYALATMEYRFPIIDPVGGVLFADFATDLGTADDVPGNPAAARDKPGSGFGGGLGIRVDSPFGLFRLDFGINDEGGNRLHFGFGQRF